jgi:hypothetical protein
MCYSPFTVLLSIYTTIIIRMVVLAVCCARAHCSACSHCAELTPVVTASTYYKFFKARTVAATCSLCSVLGSN